MEKAQHSVGILVLIASSLENFSFIHIASIMGNFGHFRNLKVFKKALRLEILNFRSIFHRHNWPWLMIIWDKILQRPTLRSLECTQFCIQLLYNLIQMFVQFSQDHWNSHRKLYLAEQIQSFIRFLSFILSWQKNHSTFQKEWKAEKNRLQCFIEPCLSCQNPKSNKSNFLPFNTVRQLTEELTHNLTK